MDEEGYIFTPATLLIFIPIIIVAIAYSGILNELNMVSNLAIGGDVTSTTALNVFSAMEKGTSDAGRRAAFNATRKVIDERKFFDKSGSDSASKAYIKSQILLVMNDYVIQSCQNLETETGREIYLNNESVTKSTSQLIYEDDINITQENPYGFFVTIKGGIPIRVTQKDQYYEGVTPPIKVPVSIQGLEDPYIWLNTQYISSNLIFSYPEYKEGSSEPYNFDSIVEKNQQNSKIQFLWDCLNGTNNPGNISNRPYYFPDEHGLSFFDRLENRTNGTSTAVSSARLSSFIIGDPLYNYHNTSYVSHVDHEYLTYPAYVSPTGVTDIKIKDKGTDYSFADPTGSIFYISNYYLNYFKLSANYN